MQICEVYEENTFALHVFLKRFLLAHILSMVSLFSTADRSELGRYLIFQDRMPFGFNKDFNGDVIIFRSPLMLVRFCNVWGRTVHVGQIYLPDLLPSLLFRTEELSYFQFWKIYFLTSCPSIFVFSHTFDWIPGKINLITTTAFRNMYSFTSVGL